MIRSLTNEKEITKTKETAAPTIMTKMTNVFFYPIKSVKYTHLVSMKKKIASFYGHDDNQSASARALSHAHTCTHTNPFIIYIYFGLMDVRFKRIKNNNSHNEQYAA